MSVVGYPVHQSTGNTFLQEAFKYATPLEHQHLIATQTTLNSAHFTLSAWIRLDSVPTSNWRHPLGLGDQHKATFYIPPDSSTLYYKFSFWGGQQAEYIVGTLQTGVWAHLVVTYDQDTSAFNVWLDGTWRGSATKCCGINFGGADAVLGLPDPLLWGNAWPGMVDEVMIIDRTLPADAIQALYSWGVPPPTAPN